MTRLGLRPNLPQQARHIAGGGTGIGKKKKSASHTWSPAQDPRVTAGPPPQQPGHLLSGVSTHLLDLSSPPPSTVFIIFFFFFQPKGKERKGNLSTTIACQAPIIFKPSSPLPFNSPYLVENFPSLKLSLISGSSSFLSLLFSKLNGT